MGRAKQVLTCGCALLLWGGCGASRGGQEAAGPESAPPSGEVGARARLQPTDGYRAEGELVFSTEGEALRVRGTVTGLTPNARHGFHIHEFGDCSAPDASTAGDHFSPDGAPHGRPGEGEHHAGDLQNLEANAAGEAQVDQVVHRARLGDGSNSDILGRSVVVHLAADDYQTQPAGASGARIACGVIEQGSS